MMGLYNQANDNTVFFVIGGAKNRNKHRMLCQNMALALAQGKQDEAAKIKIQLQSEEYLLKQFPFWVCVKN